MLASRHVVEDGSQVAEVRRATAARATALGFDDVVRGQAEIVATELATNVLRHAGRGEVLLAEDAGAVAIVAVDHGPGMRSVSRALRDGFSSGGGPGNGLGAIRRLALRFDVQTSPGAGTVVVAVVGDGASRPRPVVDGVVVAQDGEEVSGDAWGAVRSGRELTVALVDGLGHGPEAAHAAGSALRHLRARRAPEDVLADMHEALRSTRGAAAAVARLDLASGALRFAGVGNVAAVIAGPGHQRSLASMNGTLGLTSPRARGFDHRLEDQDSLVLHSDGCRTGWAFAGHAGLALRDPLLVAAVVLRDNERGTDDASVVVARREATG